MPDAGGVYSRVRNWVADAGAGIDIEASLMDSEDDSIAAALNNRIFADGTKVPTANLPMGGFRHTGVGNGAARDDYASIGQIQDGGIDYVNSTGSANAYAVAIAPAFPAYAEGMMVVFKANFANTGGATLNVNGLGAKTILKIGQAALASGDIEAGDIIACRYDGTNFQMLTVPRAIISAGGEEYTTAEKTKLAGIEAGADVTDAANVNAAGAVMETDFNAFTILAAQTDNTPLPISILGNEIVGRSGSGDIEGLTAAQVRTIINVENGADVTDADNVAAAGALMATTIATNNAFIFRNGIGTIAELPIAASRIVGRESSGDVKGMTAAQVRSLINVEDGADVTDATNVNAAGAVMESDFVNNSLRFKNSAGATGNIVVGTNEVIVRQAGEITNLAMAASTMLGRGSSGNVGALTAAQVRTLLNVEDGADNTPQATTSVQGKVELATAAEADAGSDTDRAVTPAALEETRQRMRGVSNTAVTSETLSTSQAGTVRRYTAATAITVTVNTGWTAGDFVILIQDGAGKLSLSAGTAALNKPSDRNLTARTQESMICIVFTATGTAWVGGDLEPA